MKVLLIGGVHHKNLIGLKLMLNHLTWSLTVGTEEHIPAHDLVMCPSEPVDPYQYPDKLFIFGPHFSTFPTPKIMTLFNSNAKNYVYTQPSQWAMETWRAMIPPLPMTYFPFPVETARFSPHEESDSIERIRRTEVFVYYKRRSPEDLERLLKFLETKGETNITVFNYIARYQEMDYLKCLQRCKYGVVLDAHESQGFALQEAMSCDVPLLVWNVSVMSQEYGSQYPDIPCTSVPYWDKCCGEIFHSCSELDATYGRFMDNLQTYCPREFVLKCLSAEPCAKRFKQIVDALVVRV